MTSIRMDKILNAIRKIIPNKVFKTLQPVYHLLLSWSASLIYRWPSRNLIIIGVTGTNGKTTVVHLISRILEKAGYKVGRISSIDFQIGKNTWRNSLKMTMPGRFYLQKLLYDMVKDGCDYAVIEVTSEGVKQFRHQGVNFDIGIFTNLTPEHIESHGGFENYKKAKLSFFNHLSRGKRKVVNGKEINKILIVNGDDVCAGEFLDFKVDRKYIYSCDSGFPPSPGLRRASRIPAFAKAAAGKQGLRFRLIADDYLLNANGVSFRVEDVDFYLTLPGQFNIYNALAAIAAGASQGVDMKTMKEALGKVNCIPGRMEFIDEGQPFKVIVDYAHTPDALRKVYQTLRSAISPAPSSEKSGTGKIICVLGSAGGGRDKWKRPELGKIAAEYCDHIILTNEDPYDENPEKILDEIFSGFSQFLPPFPSERAGQAISKILDRREAVRRAISLANPHDTVIITGKGVETKMMVKGGFIPWDDREVARGELKLRKNVN